MADCFKRLRRAVLARTYHFAYPLVRQGWRLTAPVKLGVRAVVLDETGHVLLVRHAYGSESWGFPGGAPRRREQLADTAVREVWEETGVRCQVQRLLGVFDSFAEGKSDHVALFLCHTQQAAQAQAMSAEIIACRFFPPDALPPLSAGTRRRLAEMQTARSFWGFWE